MVETMQAAVDLPILQALTILAAVEVAGQVEYLLQEMVERVLLFSGI
jgi:hypothetical protein